MGKVEKKARVGFPELDSEPVALWSGGRGRGGAHAECPAFPEGLQHTTYCFVLSATLNITVPISQMRKLRTKVTH